MFPNKNYENDIKYTFELNRFISYLLGVWPCVETKASSLERLKRIALILICYFFLLCDLIPTMLHVFVIEKEVRMKLKLIGPTIFTLISIVKYSNLIFSRDQMRKCLMRMDDDWRNVTGSSARDSMINRARTGRRILIVCCIFMYSSGLYFRTILPLSRGKIVTGRNTTIRHLACPAYFIFFDVQASPAYEIIFFVQFFSGFVKYTLTVVINSLAALFAMHICAQLEILMVLMNSLVKERKVKKVNEILALTVEHQIKTRNFLELIQETLQHMSLLEIMECTISICLMLYNMVMEWENKNVVAMCSYIILITSFGFNIFILCFVGEQLSVEGEKLALTASTLSWYRLPDATARLLILVIIVSNISKKLRAGKFFDLSFMTFGHVVKTSVAYFNILCNFI